MVVHKRFDSRFKFEIYTFFHSKLSKCPSKICFFFLDKISSKGYYFMVLMFLSNMSFNNIFPFSAYFLSNGFLQCMDIYLYWEKPDWSCCQYRIRPNIAASTRNPRVSRNHEKSSYRTNCRIFIITLSNSTLMYENVGYFPEMSKSPKVLFEVRCPITWGFCLWSAQSSSNTMPSHFFCQKSRISTTLLAGSERKRKELFTLVQWMSH